MILFDSLRLNFRQALAQVKTFTSSLPNIRLGLRTTVESILYMPFLVTRDFWAGTETVGPNLRFTKGEVILATAAGTAILNGQLINFNVATAVQAGFLQPLIPGALGLFGPVKVSTKQPVFPVQNGDERYAGPSVTHAKKFKPASPETEARDLSFCSHDVGYVNKYPEEEILAEVAKSDIPEVQEWLAGTEDDPGGNLAKLWKSENAYVICKSVDAPPPA